MDELGLMQLDTATVPPVDDRLAIEWRRGPGGDVTLDVSGELDLLTATELRTALEAVAAVPGHLVVDLSGVGFMDCAGLAPLLDTAGRMRAASRGLVVRPSPAVARVLDAAGVSAVLPGAEPGDAGDGGG